MTRVCAQAPDQAAAPGAIFTWGQTPNQYSLSPYRKIYLYRIFHSALIPSPAAKTQRDLVARQKPPEQMGSRSGTARKRRVALLACFAVIFIILYTLWGQPDSVAEILTPWEGQTVADLEFRRESQRTLQGRPEAEEYQPPQESAENTSERSNLRTDLEVTGVASKNEEVASSLAVQPTIGKVTISFGEGDEVYERAIQSHELHNRQMGYSQFILRERLVPGLWSKHAYIFSIIVQELSKPEDQRLKWLM